MSSAFLVWRRHRPLCYRMQEYDNCYTVCKTCVEHTKVNYNPRDPNTFRESLVSWADGRLPSLMHSTLGLMMTLMLPLLMMRHRRIPRAKWRDEAMANGKRWIEQVSHVCIALFPWSSLSSHFTNRRPRMACLPNALCTP